MGNILSGLGQLLSPIGTVFHTIFYEPIYNILMLLYHVINATGIYGAFALAIIVLTLLIRCALIPLTRKQLKSSRVMQELAPQLNALKVQYRGDPQGLMQAQQALYKEHGYSPVSGCLPLLIQLPFLYALYYAFWGILRAPTPPAGQHWTPAHIDAVHLQNINNDIYPFLPHLTHLPNLQFFWTNLATPDPWHVLPVLAALFTFIQLRMAMPVRKKPAPGAPRDATSQATQTTMYIMPLITLFFGWTFPAGLALYWTVGAIFASTQQYFLTGWGSLFVGIPGFEHLVPEPKEPPTSMVTQTGGARANSHVAGAGARSLVSASTAAGGEQPRGIRGFFQQMREMSAAATAQAEETAKARREGKVVDSTLAKNEAAAKTASPAGVTNEEGAKKPESANAASRRPRSAAKAGPVLVKPPASSTKPAKAELPEQAIQRDATTPASAKDEPLPEVAIARTASNNNGNGNNGNNGSSGAHSTSATVVRPASAAKGNGNNGNGNNGNGARKSGGNGSGKGSSGARNRNTNRPKGGR